MRRQLLLCVMFGSGCAPTSGGGDDAGAGSGPLDATRGEGDDAGLPPDATVGAGCESNEDCEGLTVCHQGRCVECTGDPDCTEGYVCEADRCVEGCRDDPGCPAGQVCEGGACVEGCRDDTGCTEGTLCREGSCVEGCREDAGCEAGRICRDGGCVEGCRDDTGCDAARICVEESCSPRGVRCRTPEDCNAGDTCEAGRCAPESDECPADAREPNDQVPAALEAGLYAGLSVCPGDLDRYTVGLEEGGELTVTLEYDEARGALDLAYVDDGRLEPGNRGEGWATIEVVALRAGGHVFQVWGADPSVRNAYGLTVEVAGPRMCVDTTVYPDADGDGWGEDAGSMDACLEPDEALDGFAERSGDCRPGDVWAHPEQQEICGDWVDDDCDGSDGVCPDSMPAVQVPDWDCAGAPPANVYAVARFPDGDGYFVDGGCFVFFEGLPGEFYVARRLARASQAPGCNAINGCTCPSLNGWPSYDRRMYAFTLRGTPDECEIITLIDHGGETQPVSNDCRKYLYQMHFYDLPYSYLGSGEEVVAERLALFPTVEVACVRDAPHANLPYQTLVTAEIERNGGWRPLE